MPPISNAASSKNNIQLANEKSIAHHIKAIRPALSVMADLGFSARQCLKGTGISADQLEQSDQGISLQQELAFYRQLLELTGDPQLGLKLGKAYRLENYGMLGYAILSAQTLGEALAIAKEYGALSFSHFELDFRLDKTEASIIMRSNKRLDASLMTLYEDRDCAAILFGSSLALGEGFPISGIDLMHEAPEVDRIYTEFFNCPVRFGQAQMCIHFPLRVLSKAMPLRDPETAEYCRIQCQHLLEKVRQNRSVLEQIGSLLRQDIVKFSSFQEVAEMLGVPERSLRRQLEQSGSKFQTLLANARYEYAKKLLAEGYQLDSIAQQLGYSEAGNFSHAFKRWSGASPKAYRDEQLKKPSQDT